MTIGDRVKKLRGKMTQSALAKILCITQPTLTAYETQGKTPNLNTLIALSDYFHVSLDFLVLGREQPRISSYADLMTFIKALYETGLEVRISGELARYDATGNDITNKTIDDAGVGDIRRVAKLILVDEKAADFFCAFIKTYTLYQDGTIDKDIFDAWYEKQLEAYRSTPLPQRQEEG